MIGLTIAKLLKADTTLMTLVPAANIFPLIVNENTELPWISYRTEDVESDYTKDGWTGDVVTFTVATFHNDYALLQTITHQIRKALEMKTDTGTGKIHREGYKEETDGVLFGTQLSFSIEIKSY